MAMCIMIRVIDTAVEVKDNSVVFHLPRPYPPLMGILAYSSSVIVDKDGFGRSRGNQLRSPIRGVIIDRDTLNLELQILARFFKSPVVSLNFIGTIPENRDNGNHRASRSISLPGGGC